jgi:hypothetical protein
METTPIEELTGATIEERTPDEALQPRLLVPHQPPEPVGNAPALESGIVIVEVMVDTMVLVVSMVVVKVSLLEV